MVRTENTSGHVSREETLYGGMQDPGLVAALRLFDFAIEQIGTPLPVAYLTDRNCLPAALGMSPMDTSDFVWGLREMGYVESVMSSPESGISDSVVRRIDRQNIRLIKAFHYVAQSTPVFAQSVLDDPVAAANDLVSTVFQGLGEHPLAETLRQNLSREDADFLRFNHDVIDARNPERLREFWGNSRYWQEWEQSHVDAEKKVDAQNYLPDLLDDNLRTLFRTNQEFFHVGSDANASVSTAKQAIQDLFPELTRANIDSIFLQLCYTRRQFTLLPRGEKKGFSADQMLALGTIISLYVQVEQGKKSYDLLTSQARDLWAEGSLVRDHLHVREKPSVRGRVRNAKSSINKKNPLGEEDHVPSTGASGFDEVFLGEGIAVKSSQEAELSEGDPEAIMFGQRLREMWYALEKLTSWPQPIKSVVGFGERAEGFFETLGLPEEEALQMINSLFAYGIFDEKAALSSNGELTMRLSFEDTVALIPLAQGFKEVFGDFVYLKPSEFDLRAWVEHARNLSSRYFGENVARQIHDPVLLRESSLERPVAPEEENSAATAVSVLRQKQQERRKRRQMRDMLEGFSPDVQAAYTLYRGSLSERTRGKPRIPGILLDSLIAGLTFENLSTLYNDIQKRGVAETVDFDVDIDAASFVAINYFGWKNQNGSDDAFVQLPKRVNNSIVLFGANVRLVRDALQKLQRDNPRASLKDLFLQLLPEKKETPEVE